MKDTIKFMLQIAFALLFVANVAVLLKWMAKDIQGQRQTLVVPTILFFCLLAIGVVIRYLV